MKLIRIQINKRWSYHAALIIHKYTAPKHQHQNNKRLLSESRKYQVFVNMDGITDIDSPIIDKKILHYSIQSTFLHVVIVKQSLIVNVYLNLLTMYLIRRQ